MKSMFASQYNWVLLCLFKALRLGFLDHMGFLRLFFALDSSQAAGGNHVANALLAATVIPEGNMFLHILL